MIEYIDYTKYLSSDNGLGILIPSNDIIVLEKYRIDYLNCVKYEDLIFQIDKIIDTELLEDEMEDLVEVLDHLRELHYYYETKK